jgi:hypothetical protein
MPRAAAKKTAVKASAVKPEPQALGGDVSDAGNATIVQDEPYRVLLELTGDSVILFHRWQSDSVEAKSRAAKGSTAKKTDDVESYIWRDDNGHICLPGEYVRGSLVDPRNGAAKYQQDPRSPRKSALDLFRAGVVSLTDLAVITKADGEKASEWDYLDRRRVTVQRNGVTRERPALNAGWKAEVELMVLLPNYIGERLLHRTITDAGRLVGVGDFRPTFGRYSVTRFEVLAD